MMAPADVRYARAILGLTQEALGDELDVHGDQVRHWESGSRKPSRAEELAIAALMLGIRRFPSRVHDALEEPVRPLDFAHASRETLSRAEFMAIDRMRHGIPVQEEKGRRTLARLFRLGLVALRPTAAGKGHKAALAWELTEKGRDAFPRPIKKAGNPSEPPAS